MITHLKVANFKAVPYLETSQLMAYRNQELTFSIEKPNVIVGPNGSGKSALLTALSMQTLTYYTDESNFDTHYINNGQKSDDMWTEVARWQEDYRFLAGLEVGTDWAPAMYYRPHRIPGNEVSVTHAMMTGYFEIAKAHGHTVEDKSSGQQSQALMQRLLNVMADKERPKYTTLNWQNGRTKEKIDSHCYSGSLLYMRNSLLNKYKKADDSGLILVLMDEPEQSLDALAELDLWHKIEVAETQVIVATHSLYPILHPERFNIIETVPGYCEQVLNALK